MTERDPIFTRLRSFWEAADPMPADLPDTMIARVWAASLDEAYEHLVLIEQTTQLVGSRGAAASVDAPATASALLMQFGSGADKVLLRVHAGPGGTLRVDGWLSPVRAAVVHLEGPDRLTTQASAGGRFAWVGVRPGSHRLRVEAEAEASALLTDPFDL